MKTISSVDISDLDCGPDVSLSHAEWRCASSPFVLLRYAVRGRESELGLRLDLDKMHVFEDTGYKSADMRIRDHVPEISSRIVRSRRSSAA